MRSTSFSQKVFVFLACIINMIVVVSLLAFVLWDRVAEKTNPLADMLMKLINTAPGITVIVVATVLIFLNILALIIMFFPGRRFETHYRLENEKGELSVAVTALEDIITKAVRAMGGIADAKVKVQVSRKQSNKPGRVHAIVVLQNERDIFKIKEAVQDVMEKRLHEVIQIEGEMRYDCETQRFKLKRNTSETVSSQSSEKDEGQYFGPKYPVHKSTES